MRCVTPSDVQREMAERNADVPPDRRIDFRMGINVGDIIKDGRDIYGDGVNVAARLEALAEPGGISVSRVVRDQVRDKLDFAFQDMGEQQVKNIARPVRVYRISISGTAAAKAALPLPDKPSLAVLPFQNMTGDPQQEYFVDGIVEEITTAVSRLPQLLVIARNSSFTYKGQPIEIKRVARELGVRYVLEGSVRKTGNRVRITGQLIDTTTGAHIWGDRFDATLDHIFELQDRVASSVAGAIEPKLRSSEIARAVRKPTGNLSAYDLGLRALSHFHTLTPEGSREAIRWLRQALELDPSYSWAAAFVGLCRNFQISQGWEELSGEELTEAVTLARSALATSTEDPETLWMAGVALAGLAGERAAAINAIDRSLALNPNSAQAWNAIGWMRCASEPDVAIEALKRAMRLSPLDPYRWMFYGGLAFAHLTAGRYEDAMGWVDRALLEQPGVLAMIRLKIVLCGCLDRRDEARRWLARLREAQPGLTITGFKEFASARFLSPKALDFYVEGLRKAGLEEA